MRRVATAATQPHRKQKAPATQKQPRIAIARASPEGHAATACSPIGRGERSSLPYLSAEKRGPSPAEAAARPAFRGETAAAALAGGRIARNVCKTRAEHK